MNALIFVAVVVFVAVRILMRAGASKGSEWDRMARRLARDSERRRPKRVARKLFEGVVQGYPVLVERVPSSVSAEATETRYSVSYPPLGLGLFLRQYRHGDDRDDIQVGDPGFDRSHLITGGIPSQIRDFLTEPRRVRIHRVMAAYPGTRITDTGIQLIRARADSNEHDIKRVLRDFVNLAVELHREPDASNTFEAAIEARRDGRVEEAVELAREAATRDDEIDPSALVLAGESLAMADRPEDAHEAFEAALEELPDDEELVVLAAQMRARLDRPPSARASSKPEVPAEEPAAVAPPVEPLDEPEPAEPPTTSFELAAVCEELFAENRPSYDTTALFDERYAGQRVRWSGALHSLSSYHSDMVFGEGPGVKVTLELGKLDGYTGRPARVVTALPQDAEPALRELRGELLTVEGTLHRCDAFMRVLYVSEGSYEA